MPRVLYAISTAAATAAAAFIVIVSAFDNGRCEGGPYYALNPAILTVILLVALAAVVLASISCFVIEAIPHASIADSWNQCRIDL